MLDEDLNELDYKLAYNSTTGKLITIEPKEVVDEFLQSQGIVSALLKNYDAVPEPEDFPEGELAELLAVNVKTPYKN